MRLGINASRARSGGAIAHLVGILRDGDFDGSDVNSVHVWSYPELISKLPERPWLIPHKPPYLGRSLAWQMWWERFVLPIELKAAGCGILLNVDAGSVCRFSPAVTMSRDMLSYEPGEMKRYGWGVARLRLIALRYIQDASLKTADGAVFLTKYAADMIQRSCGELSNVAQIPHGVGENFRTIVPRNQWVASRDRPIRCLYISNALPYKQQWHVVDAVAQLRTKGTNIILELVGGGEGSAQARLNRQIASSDPYGEFVIQREFVPQESLPDFLADADLFVFASSCENMPNTLVEAMAAGLPIACSNRGPMPEVLEDGGLYFDPESPKEIASALDRLITETDLRNCLAERAKELSDKYSWARCAKETFAFIAKTAQSAKLDN